MSFESLPRGGEGNHFNLLRLIAASAVIVSHSYWVPGASSRLDPLQSLTGFDIGTTAVLSFFAISGFFISLSFERRRSYVDFILARVTRIVPGLFAASLVTAFIVGPLFTSLSPGQYFSAPSVWLYPVQTTSVVRIMAARLPDVFPNNAVPYAVNVSLWTLFYELACYIGLFVAGVMGLLRPSRFGLLLLLWMPAYLVARYGPWAKLTYFAVFSLPFVLGMLVYRYRASGILNGWVALGLAVAAWGVAFSGNRIEEVWSIAVGYGVLWLGFAPAPTLLAYNRIGDFSYGTYIYGFVVQQVIAALVPGLSPAGMMALALPIAILCGAVSWYCVERPAIGLRRSAVPARTDAAAPASA